MNHKGDAIDFRILQPTCGAWSVAEGVQPKAIQAIMWRSAIPFVFVTTAL
jgi:hypothetical protein